MKSQTRKSTILSIATGICAAAVSIFSANTAHASDCICPDVYEPVCGENWDRYTNQCEAACNWTAPMTGGALIEMVDRAGDLYSFWSTNDAFIDEAHDILEGVKPQRIPVLADLHYGSLCTEPAGFYPDSDNMQWADFSMELCDGNQWWITENLHDWMQQVDSWCPWHSTLVGVFDYRD